MERSVSSIAIHPLVRIATRCAKAGYAYIALPYTRTDDARNTAVLALARTQPADNDTLVMLDCDHEHPPDIVQRLVAHDVGVVGALYFRRSEPYDAMCFVRDDNGELHTPAEWEPDAGLTPVQCVGTGAIAIQAWVFKKLMAEGFAWPFFRYTYNEKSLVEPSEDIYFGQICEAAGIPHHVDFSLMTPHLTVSRVDETVFEKHKDDPLRKGTIEFYDEGMTEQYPWLEQWTTVPGWLTRNEAIHLHNTARGLAQGAQAVELGTYHGRSTIAIGTGIAQIGGRVTSFDSYVGVDGIVQTASLDRTARRIATFGLNGAVKVIESDSRQAARNWDKTPVAMMFIDASHDAEDCYGDAIAWLPHCAPGTPMLFHDHVSGWPGVVTAVGRLLTEKRVRLERQVDSIAHCVVEG